MKKYLLLIIPAFIALTSFAAATPPSLNMHPAVQKAAQDIKQSTKELNQQRNSQAKQKAVIAKQLTDLEHEIVQLRKQCAELEAKKSKTESKTTNLEHDAYNANTKLGLCKSALMGLVTEIRLSSIGTITKPEIIPIHENNLADFAKHVFKTAYNNAQLGAETIKISGNCVSPDGELKEGFFTVAGPCLNFESTDGTTAGIALIHPQSNAPKIAAPQSSDTYEPDSDGIQLLAQDISGGKALTLQNNNRGLKETIKAGGVTIIPIVALGILCVFAAIWKFLSLMRLNTQASANISEITDAVLNKDIEKAHKLAAKMGNPLSEIIKEGICHANCSHEHLEEIMHEKILAQMPLLEKRLPVLSVSAAVSPLLGLLGTVTGMIHTFELVNVFGTGNANLLSSGISEALITTEFGLIVAIPALLAHAWLSRRVKTVLYALEQTAAVFVTKITATGDAHASMD